MVGGYVACVHCRVFCYRRNKYTSICQDVAVIGQRAGRGHRRPRHIQVYPDQRAGRRRQNQQEDRQGIRESELAR